MKIHFISDTHNRHNNIYLTGGDILIHSGDATGRGSEQEIEDFLIWYGSQPYGYKVLVAGNHDWGFETDPDIFFKMCQDYGVIYLNDSGTIIKDFDTGEEIKLWGSPVQPEFCSWAFNRRVDEGKEDDWQRYEWIKPHWDLIPENTDILITHGPPLDILDFVPSNEQRVGCPHLRDAVERVKPTIHCFGHIHESHGILVKGETTFINASQLNDRYIISYKPIEVVWKNKKVKI